MSRPSSYSENIAAEICERISEGEPLRQICRDENMPAWRTVYHWLDTHADFQARFARARDLGHDAIAEEALEISNTPLEGVRRKESADGIEITREDMLGHRKLQIETRLKLLAKWNPKKYGDKLELAGNKDAPLTVQVVRIADGNDPAPR